MSEMHTAPAIPHDARPSSDADLLTLLLAVRTWANTQSQSNAAALHSAALRYWGALPTVPVEVSDD